MLRVGERSTSTPRTNYSPNQHVSQQARNQGSSQRVNGVHHGHAEPAGVRPYINPAIIQKPSSSRGLNQYSFTQQQSNGQSTRKKPPVEFIRRNMWDDWPEINVKLLGLHPSTTTWDIMRTFKHYGSVLFIDIYESRAGSRDGNGRIKFSNPPLAPVRAFWQSGRHTMTNQDGAQQYSIKVELQRGNKMKTHRSPMPPHIIYNDITTLYASRLHFGFMISPDSMMTMRTLTPFPRPNELMFGIDVTRNRINVQFFIENLDPRTPGATTISSNAETGEYDRVNQYMFQVDFNQVKTIKKTASVDGFFKLVMSLDSPPPFHRKLDSTEENHTSDSNQWSDFQDNWRRQTDILWDQYSTKQRVVSLHKEIPVIDIGRWTTYVFEFPSPYEGSTMYKAFVQALMDHNILLEPTKTLNMVSGRPAELWSIIDPPQSNGFASGLHNLVAESRSLPFEVRYQLEVCISRELLNEHNISREFAIQLWELVNTDVVSARNLLEYVADQDKRIYDPLSIFSDKEALASSARTEIPHYCAYARKATITPSTIYFSSPSVETTNRVLRHYAHANQEGRFLRVQFTDEMSEGRINSCIKQRNDEIFTRVFRTLSNGIRIGDRHFQFLAFGNSQFRENGAYFFCESSDLSCDQIRDWMGNFSHINVAAKYAARLGQCFSTTRAIHGLAAPKIITIKDIENNGYTFTDGVGKISPFLGQMIAHELGVRSTFEPSAFQFRLGGCKGILVTWPEAQKYEVHILKSQEKFSAIYNGLEIIRCSQYSPAALNRQTITILSNLGVPDGVFLKMLSTQLGNYQNAMHDNTMAVQLLCRYIDDNHMTINIAKMVRSEIKDPFVSSLLHLWRSWSIKLLKEKAKIIVEDGAFVLGCVDETDTLRGWKKQSVPEGSAIQVDQLPQIFIQVPKHDSDPKNPVYNVITGVCLVGRNPSLHPGDLRICEAVDVPALRHLRDLVVFPASGDRDIPSMCSGGDLDGDDYFVIWDKELQPTEWNCTPMSYEAPPPKAQSKPVATGDLIKFFVRYMKNDALPTIAHAHLAQSDNLDEGVKHPKCIELAKLHSKAVDYVKTGHPAEMEKRLRPRVWPHFMEKTFKPKDQQYISEKILGRLYDEVRRVDFVPQWQQPFDRRILIAYKLEDSLLKSCRRLKLEYDAAMIRIMAQHDIKTEFEIWSTFVLSKPRVGSDYKLGEEMGRISEALKARFRASCIELAGGGDFSVLGPFVAGMYKVTKEELDIALAECKSVKIVGGREVLKRTMVPKLMPLISFPWLFEKELARIATGIEDVEEERPDFPDLPPLDITDLVLKKHRPTAKVDDGVELADGNVVHRGETLDLFSHDRIDNPHDSGDDEERPMVLDDLPDLDFDSFDDPDALGPRSVYTSNSDTDIDSPDFVAHSRVSTSPDSGLLVDLDDDAPQTTHSSPAYNPGNHVLTLLSPSTGTSTPNGTGPETTSTTSGDLVDIDLSEVVKDHALSNEEALDEDDQSQHEEIVTLTIEESPLDKLARMLGS